jgi:hypothetical protein
MKTYMFERMREPSTWRGLTLLLTALGIPLAPGVADAVIAVGLAVAGFIGAVAPDKR